MLSGIFSRSQPHHFDYIEYQQTADSCEQTEHEIIRVQGHKAERILQRRHRLLRPCGSEVFQYPPGKVCRSRRSELWLSRGLSMTTMFPMQLSRLLVLLAVLLTLPVYGLAGAAQRTCQEQMTHAGQGTQASDCCPGQSEHSDACKRLGDGPLGKGGSCSACKAGFSCKSPQSFEPTPGLVLYLLPSRSTAPADLPSVLISRSPDGLWRPPTSI